MSERPLVEDLGPESSVLIPHPDGGWPEVRVSRVYMVRSDDPAVVERERQRLAAALGENEEETR